MVQSGRREWERKAAAESRGGGVGVALADFTGVGSGVEGGERWGCRR